jgi:hypothetical protein
MQALGGFIRFSGILGRAAPHLSIPLLFFFSQNSTPITSSLRNAGTRVEKGISSCRQHCCSILASVFSFKNQSAPRYFFGNIRFFGPPCADVVENNYTQRTRNAIDQN